MEEARDWNIKGEITAEHEYNGCALKRNCGI